jgi:hypothetical protein
MSIDRSPTMTPQPAAQPLIDSWTEVLAALAEAF